MEAALRVTTKVLPGNKIEITAPELKEGDAVEVFLVFPKVSPTPGQSLREFVESLPPGPRSAPTWEQLERRFQEERDSWDR